MIQSEDYAIPTWPRRGFSRSIVTSALTRERNQLGLFVVAGLAVGLLVIVSTYYVHNFKLIIGLVGGLAFVFLTLRWPEFGILCYVTLMSGLIRGSWLPGLRLGGASINISDAMLLLLLGLVFLRATTRSDLTLFGSPIILPLFLFFGAVLLSALDAIFIYDVSRRDVFPPLRTLSSWILFVPTLQLVRDERALKRLLAGLLVITCILLVGVIFPNKFSPLLPIEEVNAGTGQVEYSGTTRIYYAGDMILYSMIPVTIASLAMVKKGNQLWRIGLLGLLLFWLFRTLFRNYMLTLFSICVLLLVFFSTQERMRLLKRMAPVAVAGVLLLVVLVAAQPAQVQRTLYPVIDRVQSLGRDPIKSEGSLQWRVAETNYALVQISRHPILGLGLGNTYRPPMESEGDLYGWADKYMENGYLYIAVMMGLVGLLPFLWLCAAYPLRVILHQHEIRDDGLRAVYLGLGAAFLGMTVGNIVNPVLVFGSRLVFFPVAMGIGEVILRLEREKRVRQ